MIILGIDPGTNLLGFGAIDVEGDRIKLIELGAIRIETKLTHLDKLQIIYRKVSEMICRIQPDELAIESPFFGKNVQSMLKLGRAQGVAISAGLNNGLKVVEYSPKKIKKAITGNGNASKEQVAAMLTHFVKKPVDTRQLDATDALATAICHSIQGTKNSKERNYKDWKSFATKNSDRIKSRR
jgi:crossover junction endodeoxyribonuclease RuvC